MNNATATASFSSPLASFCCASILLQAAVAAVLIAAGPAHAGGLAQPADTALPSAAAHRLGQHPAVLVHARGQQLDPNRFIVQPPASVTWTSGPATDEPAVLLATGGSTAGQPQPAVASR